MSSSNFGPLCRDAFSQNVHIKGTMVIDQHQNIRGNAITCETLHVNGNANLGNIISDNLIVGNVITAVDFVGPLSGPVFDEMGTQILDIQQPAISNPNVISSFIPGSLVDNTVIPTYQMPPLGSPSVVPMSSQIRQDSVEHLLYYNQLQLREEVSNLREQVVAILNALRAHGIIGS